MEEKRFSKLELVRNGHRKVYSLISIDANTALCYDFAKKQTVFIKISPSAIRRGMKYNGQRIKSIQDFWNPAIDQPQSVSRNEPQNKDTSTKPKSPDNPTSATSPPTSLYGFVREGSICSSGSSASIASLRSIYSDIERRGLNSSEYIKDCVKLECKDIQLSMREKALTEELTAFKLFISEKMAASSKEVYELKLELKNYMSTTKDEISGLKTELVKLTNHQTASQTKPSTNGDPTPTTSGPADKQAEKVIDNKAEATEEIGKEESPRVDRIPGLDLVRLKNGNFADQGEWFVRRYHRYDAAHVIKRFMDFVNLRDLSALIAKSESESLSKESILSELYRLLRRSNHSARLIV